MSLIYELSTGDTDIFPLYYMSTAGLKCEFHTIHALWSDILPYLAGNHNRPLVTCFKFVLWLYFRLQMPVLLGTTDLILLKCFDIEGDSTQQRFCHVATPGYI